ncbi:MAG TPA: hypothetical protein VH458_14155 [Vicinamibacterales bacterium]
MKSQTSDFESNLSGSPTAYGEAAKRPPDAVSLESCSEFEWIIVRTRHSLYDLIVLSGREGSVLVRGGRLFPCFRRATVAGSLIGSAAVKLRSIVVGLHLELVVDGKSFVTSRIEAVARQNFIGGRAA